MTDHFDPVGYEAPESHGERGTVIRLPLDPKACDRRALRNTLAEVQRQIEYWFAWANHARDAGAYDLEQRAANVLFHLGCLQRQFEGELLGVAGPPAGAGTA